MESKENSILKIGRITLILITVVSIIFEMILFPSTDNLLGCIMMLVSTILFSAFLEESYVTNAPFSFFMLCSIFLFHYLPVPATLVILRPVSYGMENASMTFVLETIMFVIACIAFKFAFKMSKSNKTGKKILKSLGFYQQLSTRIIWIIGLMGCLGKIYALSNGFVDSVDIILKGLNVLYYYMYMPVILFFPCLYKNNRDEGISLKNKSVWIYLVFITILNLATNSRNELITPFIIIVLLYFLSLVYCNINIKRVLSPSIIVKYILIFYVSITFFTSVSQSMLLNRSIRSDVSFLELIDSTVDTILDDNFGDVWDNYNGSSEEVTAYSSGWTENYLESQWLNRFSNIRITDEVLYLSRLISKQEKSLLLKDFADRVVSTYPQPIVQFLDPSFNKADYDYSRGDILYVYSGIGDLSNFGGYRVTSNLGDGLATFGLIYFPLQFLVWYIVMRMLNTFSYRSYGVGRIYSSFGLLQAYASLARFQNADGIIKDIQYILRGFCEDAILFVIVVLIAKTIASIKIMRE